MNKPIKMDAKAYIQRGHEKCKNRDFEGAIEDYKKASELEPNNYEALCLLGEALKKSVKKDFQRVLNILYKLKAKKDVFFELQEKLNRLEDAVAKAEYGVEEAKRALQEAREKALEAALDSEAAFKIAFSTAVEAEKLASEEVAKKATIEEAEKTLVSVEKLLGKIKKAVEKVEKTIDEAVEEVIDICLETLDNNKF